MQQKLRVLIVAKLFTLPYRVLRCAAAAGAEVHVLGGPEARELVRSRFCASFTETALIDGQLSSALAAKIDKLCGEQGIALVMPGDAPSTRSLVAIKDRLKTPCFPLPTLDQFDFLNNKWKFAGLCEELGIRHPRSWLFDSRDELAKVAAQGKLPFPFIAKPLSMDGGEGRVIVNTSSDVTLVTDIAYSPIIVQEIIPGEDVGVSLYCSKGKILSQIAHRLLRGIYATFANPEVIRDIGKIVGKLNLSGVYNFDMRLTPDNQIYYLECNPRFFYNMVRSMLAGINFVAPGLPGYANSEPASVAAGTEVRLGKALLSSSFMPGTQRRMNLRVISYLLQDPVPYLRERARYRRNSGRTWG